MHLTLLLGLYILGERVSRIYLLIYYATKNLTEAQKNYSTTKKELLAVAPDKFCSYLLCSKVIICTDHAALGHET